MTMIDEEELVRLLEELGNSFEVSIEARAAIVEAATPEPRERRKKSTPIQSLVPSTRKGKGTLVAAALVLLLAGGIHICRRLTEQFRRPPLGILCDIGEAGTIATLGVTRSHIWIRFFRASSSGSRQSLGPLKEHCKPPGPA